ncbi:MAG: hypothetical protein NTY53_17025 [Kiritimatiellaeota bacterium]|nr:hypothetical protein [Kiritimatiellota bacterium]
MDATTKAVIEATAQATAEAMLKKHPCRFNEREAGNLHALSEALNEEEGNHHTLRIIVQFGRSIQDISKQARRLALLLLAGVALILGIRFGLPRLVELLGK